MKPQLESLLGQSFAFAHGRAGVLQQYLLRQTDIDRLLGAADGREVESILTELKLTDAIDQGISEGNAILQALESWVHREVDLMAPQSKRPVFQILWLQADVAVLSYMIKDAKGLTSMISQEPESGFTAYDREALKALVYEGQAGSLPSHLVTFVRETLGDDALGPQEIDTAVAQYAASLRLRLARTSGSKLIETYVKHLIDTSNIRAALRASNVECKIQNAELPAGGHISRSVFVASQDNIEKVLRKGSLYAIADAIEATKDDQNALERELTAILSHDISAMWNVPVSIEPAFAFAATALSQLKVLRMILIGKRNGLSPQEIKAALPPFLSSSHYSA